MAVSRALCFATDGPQPFGQSASFEQCPVNYSAVAMADTIIKSATERPNSMFPPGKNWKHDRVYRMAVTRISVRNLAVFSTNFISSNFLKLFWFFSIFLNFSRIFSNFSRKKKFQKIRTFYPTMRYYDTTTRSSTLRGRHRV
jgi:hypothetical protein